MGASDWSDSATFRVRTLLSPPAINGPASPAGLTPTVTWAAVGGADSYSLFVFDATAGETAASETNIAGTSFTFASNLVSGRTYRVWLRAHSNSGTHSAWSTAFTFRVAMAAPEAPGTMPDKEPDADVQNGEGLVPVEGEVQAEASLAGQPVDANHPADVDVAFVDPKMATPLRFVPALTDLEAATDTESSYDVDVDEVMRGWHQEEWWDSANGESSDDDEDVVAATDLPLEPLAAVGPAIGALLFRRSGRAEQKRSRRNGTSRR